MKDDQIFMVYRLYTKEERPDPDQRAVFFGWSKSKTVVKAFLMQRSKEKYRMVRMDSDEAADIYSDLPCQFEEMTLDFVNLKSVRTGAEVPFFTTLTELQETEVRIQRLVREAASLKHPSVEVVEAFVHIDRKYGDALHFIGFRPPEVDQLYPSADETDDLSNDSQLMAQIETAYTGGYAYPGYPPQAGKIPGLDGIEDPCKRVLYSLESFVKVLKEDL